jgi:serine protease Do
MIVNSPGQCYSELIRLKACCYAARPIFCGTFGYTHRRSFMTQVPTGSRRRVTRVRAATAAGIGLAAVLALSPLVSAQTTAPVPPSGTAEIVPQQSFAPLVKKVLPAVVNISVTEKAGSDEQFSSQLPEEFQGSPFDEFLHRFFEQRRGEGGQGGRPEEGGAKRIALGSGFIIDQSGTVVTNNHVVGEAAKVEVVLQDNTKYPAKIVGRDPRTDVAVLKIKADKPLPYVNFGDSNAAQVGDWVVAVGNPFGLGGSVTTGIISARGRDIHSGQFDDFLQIDAPINRGNSGGPTFDLKGEVIGINTAIYSPNGGSVGIGFAVPSNVAKNVVDQIEAHGKVTRGWLGVQIQQVTQPIAASLGLKSDHGAIVAAVSPNSPGAAAGLKQGDVVLSFNGTDIKEMRDLPRLVAATSPGTKGTLKVWRNGESVDLEVTIGDMPENPQVAMSGRRGGSDTGDETGRAQALGLQFATLSDELRRELHVGRDVHGAVITGVGNGSLSDSLGFERGDVIVSINQQPVQNAEDAARMLKSAADSAQKSALLLINRHGQTRYVGVDLSHNQG